MGSGGVFYCIWGDQEVPQKTDNAINNISFGLNFNPFKGFVGGKRRYSILEHRFWHKKALKSLKISGKVVTLSSKN